MTVKLSNVEKIKYVCMADYRCFQKELLKGIVKKIISDVDIMTAGVKENHKTDREKFRKCHRLTVMQPLKRHGEVRKC